MSTADDFVFRTLIADHKDPATASRALAMHRAEVLREAAEVVHSMDTDPSTRAAADELRRMADAGQAGKDTRQGESTQLAGQQLAGAVLDDVTDSEPNQPPHCARCHQHFDPTDTRFDGHAQHQDTPFCRQCVDRCHESSDAFHQCAVCRTPAEGGEAR
jgi:hypothetical protein